MRGVHALAGAVALFVARAASAQPSAAPAGPGPAPAAEPPPPSAPAPGALVPPAPPSQPTYSPGYRPEYPQAQPGYGPPPPYAPGYGYGYREPPLPPPPQRCCRWSARFDPFDLVYRRVTVVGEIAVTGPFSLQIEPSWIFGSAIEDTDAKGFAIAGDAAYYLGGRALRGFWLKLHGGYERSTATVTNPLTVGTGPAQTGKGTLSSGLIGALFGSSIIFGSDGGFALSAGLGIGYATAPQQTITAQGRGAAGAVSEEFYTGLDKVRLLGSVSLGVTL